MKRNVHCSNCGDTRGGPLGHETSECTYRRRVPSRVQARDEPCADPAGCDVHGRKSVEETG